jgi:hypothetical protein
MLHRLVTPLLFAALLTAATPAPTLVQHAGNVLDSMQAASDDLSTQLAALKGSSARLGVDSGPAAILALHGDVYRIDATCEALSLKAGRLVEIAAELSVEVVADP